MYSVSSAYLTAMKQDTFTRTLRGKIGNINYTIDDVLTGSCTITNKISDGTEVRIGSVNIGTLTITFINDHGITDWSGQIITVEEGLLLEGGTYEYVPMGKFIVSEAQRTASGTVVTAYDFMSKFDKRWQISTTSGKAFSFLNYICQQCGVTLGMTQEQVEALPNGNTLLGLFTENDIETFRDALSWIAQTLGCYATIDREGQLVVRAYKSVPDDTVTVYQRYTGDTFSTFATRYSGVSVVDIKNGTTRYKGMPQDIYLTYNLGSNPFMQYGSQTTKDLMLQNILTALQNVVYVPFSVVLPIGGAYDLGDVITFSGGHGDVTGCITSYTWNFNGTDNYIAKGEGKDPSLVNARSKTDKDISGLASRLNSTEIQYYIFRNIEEINIGNNQEKELINIHCMSMANTTVIMDAEILLDVETAVSGIDYYDAVGTITYYVDFVKKTDYVPIETWVDGNHILHLMYVMNIESSQLCRFVATLKMSGGSAHIPPLGVNAVIHGQGLAATDEWDGYIDLEDTIGEIDLGGIEVEDNIIDEVSLTQDTPYSLEFTEEIGEIDLGGVTLENNMSEELLIDKKMMSSYTYEQLSAYTYEDLSLGFIYG